MFVALDLATKTGIGFWDRGWDKPRSLLLELPSLEGYDGAAYTKLHRELFHLHQSVGEIHWIWFERPMVPRNMDGKTSARTVARLMGLVAHADSFGHAVGATVEHMHQGTWRRYFLGKGGQETTEAFKRAAMVRCAQLGWYAKDNNCADALGQLAYGLYLRGESVPWKSTLETIGSPFIRRDDSE